MSNLIAHSRARWPALLLAIGASLGCTTLLGDDFKIEASDGNARTDGGAMPPGSDPCQPGERQCAGKVLRTCNASGAWQVEVSCPNLCAGGACAGECPPGS